VKVGRSGSGDDAGPQIVSPTILRGLGRAASRLVAGSSVDSVENRQHRSIEERSQIL
jgi:hypothetical protein